MTDKRANKNQHQCDYFNKSFISIYSLFNYFLMFYLIFSSVLSFVNYVFNDKTTEETILKTISGLTSTSLLDYILLIFLLFLGAQVIINKSTISLIIQMITLTSVSLQQYIYLFNIKLFSIGFTYISNLFVVFTLVYSVLFYFKLIQYFKFEINLLPQDKIVHEINLRNDMIKIGFNNTLIKMNVHKLFPSLLFGKEDYYFTKCEQYEPNYLDEYNDQVTDLTYSKDYGNQNKNLNHSNASTELYSKSHIDCEYEPLK